MRLPVITLKEFPLYLILEGIKDIEVRPFKIPVGPVLLHSNTQCWSIDVPPGAIVATAINYVSVEADERLFDLHRSGHRIAGPMRYKRTTYLNNIADVTVLYEPIPVKGKLGLWYHDIDPDTDPWRSLLAGGDDR